MMTVQGIVYCWGRAVVLDRRSTAADSGSRPQPTPRRRTARSKDRTRKRVGVQLAFTIAYDLRRHRTPSRSGLDQCWHTPEPRQTLRQA